MPAILPDCMMPDGAEPCKGYLELQAQNAKAEKHLEQLQAKLHCMCGSEINHSAWEGHTPLSMYDYALDQAQEKNERLVADNMALREALKLARRSMTVSVTGITDGITVHDIRQWIEKADAALANMEADF